MLELRRERFDVAVALIWKVLLSAPVADSLLLGRCHQSRFWPGCHPEVSVEWNEVRLVLGDPGRTSIWEETPRCQGTHSKCQYPTSPVFDMALVAARSVSDGGAWQWRGYLGSSGASQKPRATGASPGWLELAGWNPGCMTDHVGRGEGARNGTSEISGPNLFLGNSCLPRVKSQSSTCAERQSLQTSITACYPRKPCP